MSKQTTQMQFTAKELRDFGLIMAVMLILMFGLVLPWLFSFNTPIWPFVAAPGFALTAWVKPMWLDPVNRVWLKLSLVLGWINTRLIMGIIFFLLIVPIGIVMRLFTKDPLNKALSDSSKTYRVLTKVRDKTHLEKPF